MSVATVTTPTAEPPRDRYGRYLLPVPGTDKREAHTRVTTIAGTIADRYNLELWQQRMVALGIGARRDLYALASSLKPEDKKALNDLCRDAREAAAGSSGANLGTALHSFTARLDSGEAIEAPAPWDADLAAYQATMRAAGVGTHPWWVERVLYRPGEYAGTTDRLLWLPGRDLPVIGDVKTGSFLSFDEIALQLAMYANATHWYDPATDQWGEVPAIDKSTAVVIALPVGKARCELHTVDIAAGWEAVSVATWVRSWRKRKDLAQPYTGGAA